jgi:hypothetical protein
MDLLALADFNLVAGDLGAGRLSNWGAEGLPVAVWALHASRKLVSSKVTAFVDFLFDAFPDAAFRPSEYWFAQAATRPGAFRASGRGGPGAP